MKSLLKLLSVSLMVLVISSCGALNRESKAQAAAEQALNVRALKNANFILEVTQIIPVGFPSKSSLGEYKLTLDGDVVDTRLPFIGTSHEPVFGNDEMAIVFDNETVDLTKDFSKADKGKYVYKFKGGKGRSPWSMQLTVFDSGSASIDCFCDDGRIMHFYADLKLPKLDEK